MILKYTALSKDNGETVLYILKHRLHCSGTLVKRLKSNQTIFLNGKPVYCNIKVNTGDTISIAILEHRLNNGIPPQDIPLKILFEDEFIIAINKEPGIAVHPAGNYQDRTMANALRFYFKQKDIDMTVRPIGRLDRNTSGVIIFAKNCHVMSRMIIAMKNPEAKKIYMGIVHGIPDEAAGIIDLPIKRAEDSIIARISAADGKPSRTFYRLIEKYSAASLVEFELLTGRTHQIRLHCKEKGFPLVGDGIYGDDSKTSEIINRHALHCRKVVFLHPFTGKIISISAPFPDDFIKAQDYYRKL